MENIIVINSKRILVALTFKLKYALVTVMFMYAHIVNVYIIDKLFDSNHFLTLTAWKNKSI